MCGVAEVAAGHDRAAVERRRSGDGAGGLACRAGRAADRGGGGPGGGLDEPGRAVGAGALCRGGAAVAALLAALAGKHHLVADVSDARAVFTITGDGAREVLAKCCPVDVAPGVFGPGEVRRTRAAQVAAAVWMSVTIRSRWSVSGRSRGMCSTCCPRWRGRGPRSACSGKGRRGAPIEGAPAPAGPAPRAAGRAFSPSGPSLRRSTTGRRGQG
jgi:hypothetical protein